MRHEGVKWQAEENRILLRCELQERGDAALVEVAHGGRRAAVRAAEGSRASLHRAIGDTL